MTAHSQPHAVFAQSLWILVISVSKKSAGMQTNKLLRERVECPSDSFAAFYDNAAFSDVVLKARDTKMHAHKLVLAAHSASLQAMFQVSCIP